MIDYSKLSPYDFNNTQNNQNFKKNKTEIKKKFLIFSKKFTFLKIYFSRMKPKAKIKGKSILLGIMWTTNWPSFMNFQGEILE